MGIDEMEGSKSPAKAAHVNMMTDTIIANLPPEGLRTIMRGMLGGDPTVTSNFHRLVSKFLENTRPSKVPRVFEFSEGAASPTTTSSWNNIQSRYRCLMGCGNAFESMGLLTEVIWQVRSLEWNENVPGAEDFLAVLAAVDGDVVQAVTGVQKTLLASSDLNPMSGEHGKVVVGLKDALDACKAASISQGQSFAFERGMSSLNNLLRHKTSEETSISSHATPRTNGFVPSELALESVSLGPFKVPRMFMGLWQQSSPAWGTASRIKIENHFRKHVDAGLIAYDMADHYGDAEVTFGQFRNSQSDSSSIYCATKWCIFEPIQVSKGEVDANIEKRLVALNATSIELLQFHWQDYNDHQYIEAAKLIEKNPRVQAFGLCNFDTLRMNEVVESGVAVVSNQVQFSLIDLRPTFEMAASCLKHKIKLLTYGSLCGGFLADKWLQQPAPNLFDQKMTPSHRKYLEMITIWGGWSLFQELLGILADIGKRYDVSISSVAIRWILDHEYVGSVIIGARMGISEHIEENLKALSFVLDAEDRARIDVVLTKCNAKAIFEEMGDCGSEYR